MSVLGQIEGRGFAAPAAVPTLGVTTKVLYSTGSVAFGLKLAALNSMLLLFCNQVVGLPPEGVGLMLMATTIVDAILDPLIGLWSDSTRSRLGRRHGFMYAAAVPSALAFCFLWAPPYDWSEPAQFAYIALVLIALRVLISFYEVPNAALAPELAPQYDDRTRLLAWRWTFGAIGTFAMTLVVYMVLLVPSASYPVGLLNRDGYAAYGALAAVIIFVSILLSAAGTHRFIPVLAQPRKGRNSLRVVSREVVETLRNRNFGVMVFSGLAGAVSTGLSTGLLLYVNSYFWQFSTQSVGLIVASGVVAAFCAFIVTPIVAKRLGKRNAAVWLFALSWIFANGPVVLGLVGWMPPAGTVPLFLVLVTAQLLAGITGTGGYILASSMIADVVEESQVRTGRRSEGLLMSADTVLQKSVSGIGLFLSGVVLSLAQFPQNAVPGAVDPEIVRNLLLYSLPITATTSGLGIGALMLYRIDRAAHERNLAMISR